MNLIGRQIRERRRLLGLSQSALARAAGVSLATVQNTEAGRANPALSTLSSLLAPLGLAADVAPTPADWDALVALGLPLAGEPPRDVVRDAETLRRHIGRATLALARDRQQAGAERKREGLQALLLALHTHFPSVTRRWLRASPPVRALLRVAPSGRVVKLARIARQTLSEYL